MQRFVDVRSLVAIVTLSEELSFTRAAKRLGMSQSGLSRHVSSLEQRHRIKLFDRDHANVTLTDGGRAFVEEAFYTTSAPCKRHERLRKALNIA